MSARRLATPPHDDASEALYQAERALIGAALQDDDELAHLLGALTPKDFLEPRHRVIMRTMMAMASEGPRVRYDTVAERLEADGAPVTRDYLWECLRAAFDAQKNRPPADPEFERQFQAALEYEEKLHGS